MTFPDPTGWYHCGLDLLLTTYPKFFLPGRSEPTLLNARVISNMSSNFLWTSLSTVLVFFCGTGCLGRFGDIMYKRASHVVKCYINMLVSGLLLTCMMAEAREQMESTSHVSSSLNVTKLC